MSDEAETIDGNQKSWAAWKREAERLQAIIDANREAQPVAYLKKSIIDSERFDSADPEIILHPNTPEGWLSEYQAVFTAPPAPAVPDFGSLTKLIVGRLIDCGAAGDDSIADAETFVYNACRAAMLAQPVSQGCKLVPVPTVKKFIPVSSVSSTVNGTEPFPAALTCEEAAALDGTIFLSHLKPGGMVQVYAAVGKDDDRELIAFNPKDFKFTAPEGGN
ncbi:hypothetical protein [Serratia liquefaciens]|uniref:hypothetical protein n=1 Tax=Serratia liquefaciens TaxID=614 RepID=UPI00301DD83F